MHCLSVAAAVNRRRSDNDQKIIKDRRTNNDLQNITQQPQDRVANISHGALIKSASEYSAVSTCVPFIFFL